MKNKLINLHLHSHFSVLDGMGTPEQIVKKTKELGLPAVAITDHGSMNSYAHLYKAARKDGIKPIFGNEFYHVLDLDGWHKYYENGKEEKVKGEALKKRNQILRRRYHLIVLVKNEKGFENINQMIYKSYKNFYYKPRIDKKILEEHSEGLIVSSACMSGEVPKFISAGKIDKAEEAIDFYKGIFGKDYYIEIQFNEMDRQKSLNPVLIELARKHKVKVIVTQDSHYIEADHSDTQQTLLLMQTKRTWEEKNRGVDVWEFETKELYYKTYKEVWESANKWGYDISKRDFQEYCENTFEIADKVKSIELDTSVKMKDINPEVKDKMEYFEKLCFRMLKKKGFDKDSIYIKRLKREIDLIEKKKFVNYFLTIHKIVGDARKKMLVGPGRGSGAGCLVNYLLRITDVDPIKHKLYFERFLSEERTDLPDIDIDFEENSDIKLGLMKEYPEEVACITSYSTFQLFGLLKDLGRTYSVAGPQEMDKLNKTIKKELEDNYESDDEDDINNSINGISFSEADGASKTFHNFVTKYKDLARDMNVLMNQVRHIGRHAAGVVISDGLIKNQPVMVVDGIIQTSLSEGTREKTLSEFGFVKIDVLGLETLRMIHKIINYISFDKDVSPQKVYKKIKADDINLEDEKVFRDIFIKLNLLGIFQFEGGGIRKLIDNTKPDCFEDIVAMNALYRPGPLNSGMAFEYGGRKRGEENIDYYGSDIVERILKSTYGILVYQEQVMELGHYLGGLSLSDTNLLRKLLDSLRKIDKSRKEKLDAMKVKFIKGAKSKGMSEDNIDRLWGNMTSFSRYGFNRSHAVSYALVAYQCAWLKTYYPVQFYTALLNSKDSENYMKIINEARKNGISVETVNINKSDMEFTYEENTIYWGLAKVLGIGEKASSEIVRSRRKKPFKGLRDFILREDIQWRVCNKKVITILIDIGAFEKEKESRKLKAEVYKAYIERKNHKNYKDLKEWDKKGYKDKIFDYYIKKIKEVYKSYETDIDFSDKEKMEIEEKYYKSNINYSPFMIGDRKAKIKRLFGTGKAGGVDDDLEYVIVNFRKISRVLDKKGREMAFIDMVDVNGNNLSGLIFSSYYEKKDVIEGNIYCIQGNNRDKFIIEIYKNLDFLLNKSV